MNNKLVFSNKPKYSICICNFNMADTIEASLTSLVSQINENTEIVFVDDGSTDQSIAVAERVKKIYGKIRIISLARDRHRKLGYTRNISIKEAYGDYVLLHLDCDDIFGSYLNDFIKIFHKIQSCFKNDILLSGQHINMAKKDFLLAHGPYLNLYRGEDRNLWSRMAKIKAWIPLDHIDFIVRLPKSPGLRLKKNFFDTLDHMINDFRSGVGLLRYFRYELNKRHFYSMKLFLFRIFMLLPSFLLSLTQSKISQDGTLSSPEEFAAYRDRIRGTFPEIMNRHKKNPSLDFLNSVTARKIFSRKANSK